MSKKHKKKRKKKRTPNLRLSVKPMSRRENKKIGQNQPNNMDSTNINQSLVVNVCTLLVWDDFHARSAISEEKWGTTGSLHQGKCFDLLSNFLN